MNLDHCHPGLDPGAISALPGSPGRPDARRALASRRWVAGHARHDSEARWTGRVTPDWIRGRHDSEARWTGRVTPDSIRARHDGRAQFDGERT